MRISELIKIRDRLKNKLSNIEHKINTSKFNNYFMPLTMPIQLETYKQNRRENSKLPKWNKTGSQRVLFALKRISRDRYLHAEEVRNLAWIFTDCTFTSNRHSTFKHGTCPEWLANGMINGDTPFWVRGVDIKERDKAYRLRIALKNMSKNELPELAILKIQLRSLLK